MNSIVKATAGVAKAYQEAERSFDKKREESLRGLPWLLGMVADVISGLQDEYPKARFKRVFWDDNHFSGEENLGWWVLEITYPRSEMGSVRADCLKNQYCFQVMDKYGITVNLESSGRRE